MPHSGDTETTEGKHGEDQEGFLFVFPCFLLSVLRISVEDFYASNLPRRIRCG